MVRLVLAKIIYPQKILLFSFFPFYVDYNYAYDIIGDTNNDNKVNNKDISTLLKYLAGWNITINPSQADINQDGYITMKDVNSLIRLLVVY